MPHEHRTQAVPRKARARATDHDRHTSPDDGQPRQLVKRALSEVTVSEVMSTPVACPLDASLETIEGLFLDSDAQAVVVVDTEGRPRGIITKTDLVMQHFSAAEPETVGEELLDEVTDYECPVCGDDARTCGCEAEDTPVEAAARHIITTTEERGWELRAAAGRQLRAVQLMSPGVATANAAQSICEALAIIEREQVFTLPVVAGDDDPTLVGMLCARDLVDWLGRCVGAGRRVGNGR